MKIKKLEIYGFGKWIDQTFDVSNDLFLFVGKNESGKTTLMTFIHHILFGFPTRHRPAQRYEPRLSSRYGGKLWIEDEKYGRGFIERIDGKVSGDVRIQFESGLSGSEGLLKEILYGIDRAWYEAVYSFDLGRLRDTHLMSPQELQHIYLSAGVFGAENYLDEISQKLKSADQLFKAQGRVLPINQQLKRLEEIEKKVQTAQEKNSHYLEELQAKDSLIKELETHRTHLSDKEKKVKLLEELIFLYEDYEKMKRIRHEILNFDHHVISLREMNILENMNQQVSAWEGRLLTLQKRIQAVEEDYPLSNDLKWSQSHPEAFYALKNNIKYLEDLSYQLDYSEKLLKNETGNSESSQIYLDAEYVDQESLERLLDQREQWQNVQDRSRELSENRSELEATLKHIDTELDRLESKMSDEKTTQNNMLERLSMMLFFFGVILMLMTQNGWLLSFSLFGIILYLYTRHHPIEKENIWKEEWQFKLAQADEVNMNLHALFTEEKIVSSEMIMIKEMFTQFKLEKRWPESTTIDEAINFNEQLEDWRERKVQLQKLQKEHEKLELKLVDALETHHEILALLEERELLIDLLNDLIRWFNRVDEEAGIQKDFIKRRQDLYQEEKLLRAELVKINQIKLDLFERFDIKNEVEFVNRFEASQRYEEVIKEKEQLEGKLKDYEDDLSIYQSKDELEKELESEKNKIQDIQEKTKTLENHYINQEVSIRDLETQGTYRELLQKFENEKSQLQKMAKDWLRLQVDAAVIKETLAAAQADVLPKILKNASRFFKILTAENYIRINVTDNILEVVSSTRETMSVDELSTATREQLFISLRFAFIEDLSKHMPLPLIIDDGFVNFDRERKVLIYKVLRELSKETQVIYFTFDDDVDHYFESSHYCRLSVEK